MTEDLLDHLRARLADDLDGIERTDDGLEAVVDARFGVLGILVEHEAESESIRVSVELPAPVGAGADFLIFCLVTNARYWDAKIGVDDDGLLLVHADLDSDLPATDLAARVAERVETILELVDDDLTEWLLREKLGTPAQRARWESRSAVSPDAGTDED